jgi:hypothetical protein
MVGEKSLSSIQSNFGDLLFTIIPWIAVIVLVVMGVKWIKSKIKKRIEGRHATQQVMPLLRNGTNSIPSNLLFMPNGDGYLTSAPATFQRWINTDSRNALTKVEPIDERLMQLSQDYMRRALLTGNPLFTQLSVDFATDHRGHKRSVFNGSLIIELLTALDLI